MSFQKLLPKFDFADDRFDWENDSIGVYDRNAKLFSVIAMMYVPVVFALEQVMKYREPFKLTGLLIFWNFLLSILSGYGAYLTVPQGFIFYREKGWTGAVCNLDCYHHPYAVIILLFNLTPLGPEVNLLSLPVVELASELFSTKYGKFLETKPTGKVCIIPSND